MKTMVCYDASAASTHALHVAKRRAKKLGARILIATSAAGGKDASREDFERFENLLDKARAGAEEEGLPCEVLLSVSSLTPGENLCRIAEEKKIDEIYIGVRKRSRVGKLIFGSTVQYVILHAPCPVTTVK